MRHCYEEVKGDDSSSSIDSSSWNIFETAMKRYRLIIVVAVQIAVVIILWDSYEGLYGDDISSSTDSSTYNIMRQCAIKGYWVMIVVAVQKAVVIILWDNALCRGIRRW